MEAEYFDPKILRQLRREAGLYQKDLAEHLGVSRETVLHIEKGKQSSIRSLELVLLKKWFQICSEQASPTTKKRFAQQIINFLTLSEVV